jgi:taurine dioxygenase
MPTPQSRTEQRPAFRTRPLHPALGVEVTSIDARAAGNGTIEELQALLVEHQLLVLREQELDPSALVEFARRFGEPEIFPAEFAHPDSRSVLQISNRSERPSAAYWHTDGARQPEPPSLTLLYAEQVPDEGGDTLFLNTYAAYEALDAEDKETLGGLRALLGTGVEHPIVRTHPVTGRRALYVDMGYTTGVKGVEREEALRLFRELDDYYSNAKWVYRHRYRKGDLAIWDNACVSHSATEAPDPEKHVRVMLRATVRGGPVF